MGGYIVRNTWRDGLGFAHGMRARGSHSAAFYMQNDVAEEQFCPNPHSARSWEICPTLDDCASARTRNLARGDRKVLYLQCLDTGLAQPAGACTKGFNYTLTNLTEFGSAGLFVACFLRARTPSVALFAELAKKGKEASPPSELPKCYPPMTLDDLALVFSPTDAELERVGVNDPSVCGYNFVPYETLEALQARFYGGVQGAVTVTSYDIEWTERSYAATITNGKGAVMAQQHSPDYSQIRASTHALRSTTTQAPWIVPQ